MIGYHLRRVSGAFGGLAFCLFFICSTWVGAAGVAANRFGDLELKYQKTAGPIQIVGSYPGIRVVLNGQEILQDQNSESIWIVGAFPSWESPETAILNFSPGGNSCAGTFAVLNVKTGQLTDKFGNCNQPVVKEGSNFLVFAFPDDPSEIGWLYQNGKLNKVPTLQEEQHVEKGVSSYKSKNYSLALAHLWLVRESRYPDASYYLGLMADFGRGIKQDYLVAMSFYKAAVEVGSPDALFRIGFLFANGRGVAKNLTEADQWYSRAANLGQPLAQYYLALAYLNGAGVPIDLKQALFWMLVAQDRLTDLSLMKGLQDKIGMLEGRLDEESQKSILESSSNWKPTQSGNESNLATIKAWVGKYPIDRLQGLTFLERPEVQLLINGALGSDAIAQMKTMSVVSLIEENDGWLIASGCQPHQCLDGQWLVAINLSNLETRACLALTDAPTVRFGETGRSYIDLPRGHEETCPKSENALEKIGRFFSTPANSGAEVSKETAIVPLLKSGGTFLVPVVINNAITLNFIIDSGAADVSIPADVFLTLARTGTLKDEDFTGTQTYRLADGSTTPSTTFRIRSLKVGRFVVENVSGSIAPSSGPLLLGQSFLKRFVSWSIDNSHEVLILGAK